MAVRKLILMRHAKSSWGQPGLDDHARPLNERGRRDAQRMGAALRARGWVPDLATASDSTRTRETWALAAAAFAPSGVALIATASLYHAGLDALRSEAGSWDPSLGTVLALGHNPGWSSAVSRLCGQEVELTTGNCALLAGVGATWTEALWARWELVELLRPRDLA